MNNPSDTHPDPTASETPNDKGSDAGSGSRVFPITTLRDIFNLPTFGQMETCLRELTEGMIQARLANDTLVALMREAGGEIERAIEWPEVANWNDDGKGEIRSTFHGDGIPTISVTTKVDPENA